MITCSKFVGIKSLTASLAHTHNNLSNTTTGAEEEKRKETNSSNEGGTDGERKEEGRYKGRKIEEMKKGRKETRSTKEEGRKR